jgi:hypothetical protein
MKKITVATGSIATLILSALTAFAQTQSRDDILKRTLPLRSNSTYLVRSINYSDSDVLVAFRVVRVDTDGSAILLWKSLATFAIPQITRNQ